MARVLWHVEKDPAQRGFIIQLNALFFDVYLRKNLRLLLHLNGSSKNGLETVHFAWDYYFRGNHHIVIIYTITKDLRL